MLTVGYFYFRDRKLVKLASDLDDGSPRTTHTIPRVHIVRMTQLTPGIPWEEVKEKLKL